MLCENAPQENLQKFTFCIKPTECPNVVSPKCGVQAPNWPPSALLQSLVLGWSNPKVQISALWQAPWKAPVLCPAQLPLCNQPAFAAKFCLGQEASARLWSDLPLGRVGSLDSLTSACPQRRWGHVQLDPGVLQPSGRAWELPALVNEGLLVTVGRPPTSDCPVEKV